MSFVYGVFGVMFLIILRVFADLGAKVLYGDATQLDLPKINRLVSMC